MKTIQRGARTLAAATVITLAFLAACSSGPKELEDDPGDLATGEAGIGKTDPNGPGTGKLHCGPCVPDKTSPKGGWKECVTPAGDDIQSACVPPAPPPPPPPPPKVACNNVTVDGVCHRLCCTDTATSKECSALPCGKPSTAFEPLSSEISMK